jgi:hypothetical protein
MTSIEKEDKKLFKARQKMKTENQVLDFTLLPDSFSKPKVNLSDFYIIK